MQPDSTIHWQVYPALGLAGGLAGGIGLASRLPGTSFWVWAGIVLAATGLGLLPRRLFRQRLVSPVPLLGTLAALLAATALGGARTAFERSLPPHHIVHHVDRAAGAEATLTGRVLTAPVDRRSGTRFVVAVAMRDGEPAAGRVQVTLARSSWGTDVAFPRVEQGAVVALHGRLRPVPRRRNPADFDYGRYLKQHGIYATLSIRDAAAVVVQGHRLHGLERVVVPLQAYVRRHLARLIPSSEARAVLHALVLGDRGSLEDETRRQFARTGLTHLLAVSGLHVLLVGMVFYGLLRPLLMRLRLGWWPVELIRSAVTVVLLGAYVLVAGASASAVRALVMAVLLIGGTILQRSAHPLNTLGVAALALLLMQPGHLFEPGFQLSFAAVGAIVTLQPLIRERLPVAWMAHPASRHVMTVTTVSVAATLGTAPVLLYHFGQVSAAGLVLNLVAIPLTALVLAAGLAALLLGGWFTAAAEVFGAAADLLARLLLGTAALGDAALGWAVVQRYVRDPWVLLIMAAGLVMLAQWPRPRLRWRLAAGVLCFATVAVWARAFPFASLPHLDVLFFDVGHGDAALIGLPGGRHVLVDAGGRDAFADVGTRTLLPHLERYGIRRLDAVLITHPHSDHLGGLPGLLRGVPVGRVLHNGQSHASSLFRETVHLLDSLTVPHRTLRPGDTLAMDPDVLLQILAPEETGMEVDANEASVVLRLVYGQTIVLFTGDAEAGAEQRMAARYGPLLSSDVVKVGHHGSRTSSTEAFVRLVAPDTARGPWAVVSVGPASRFGLPDEEVLERWQARRATVWITAHGGALWLRSDGKTVRRRRWR